jgi:hypothetical protein
LDWPCTGNELNVSAVIKRTGPTIDMTKCDKLFVCICLIPVFNPTLIRGKWLPIGLIAHHERELGWGAVSMGMGRAWQAQTAV